MRIQRGLALVYDKRRGAGAGLWTVRIGLPGNRYRHHPIGIADDFLDADGEGVLDYFQAQARARELWTEHQWGVKEAEQSTKVAGKLLTVDDCFYRGHQPWLKAHRKSATEITRVYETHIRPRFGEVRVGDLTAPELAEWHHAIAASPPALRTKSGRPRRTRPLRDGRARKATANRVLTVLKALLNYAYTNGLLPDGVIDDAWRKVRPFKNVSKAKVQYLSEDECRRLVNACSDGRFRDLVRAALYTGCRYGELVKLRCADFSRDASTVHVVDPKNGVPRYVHLSPAADEFFSGLALGQPRDALMFVREGDLPWGHAHQVRPMLVACKAAGIDPPVSFHALRHTVGSALAMKGVPIQVIAQMLGHKDTRITEHHYAHLRDSYVAETIRTHLPDMGAFDDGLGNVERIA